MANLVGHGEVSVLQKFEVGLLLVGTTCQAHGEAGVTNNIRLYVVTSSTESLCLMLETS